MSTSHHVGPGVGYDPIHSVNYKFWLDVCYGFYPRDAMLARVIAIATCLSVRLSRAGIVSKRRKLAS